MKYDPFWVKYRWEFMRRNNEFRKAYDDLIAESKNETDPIKKPYVYMRHAYKWGFWPECPRFPNPYNSFEKEFKPEEIQIFFKHDSPLNSGKKYDSKIVGETLCIFINLKKIGSTEKIKEKALQDIDNSFIEIKKIEDKARPIKKVDYDLILQVGDLRKEGLTYEQIAKVIFPRDFISSNKKAKTASAIRKAGQYFKRFQELVEFYKPHPRINKY